MAVALQDKPLQLLLALLESPNLVVSREELYKRLWATDTFVCFDEGLNTVTRKLRQSLNDSAETPRIIETVPKRGYRFIAKVEFVAPTNLSRKNSQNASKQKSLRNLVIAAGMILVIAEAVLVVVQVSKRKSPKFFSVVAPPEQLSGDARDAVNAGSSSSSSNTSHTAKAQELYLQALTQGEPVNSANSSFSSDTSNKAAIRLLQRAVALDAGYSPAWAALGHYYYYDSNSPDGGRTAKLRAKAALRRAVALDPGRVDAASDLINLEIEEGELNGAYDNVTQLLHQHPDSGEAHLIHAFVLWYAGLLDESARECEKTRSIDAGVDLLAPCSYVFTALGRYDRAREFLQLRSGTEYEKAGEVDILLREGKRDEALQHLSSLLPTAFYGQQLLKPCLQHRPTAEVNRAGQQVRSQLMGGSDGLGKYVLATWDSLCEQPDRVYPELRQAIAQNYCAYPQMETDPLLATVRAMPEFAEIRSLGIACQQHFLEHRANAASR
jgi:DNA-binding winged helix-turn-helix (wHTH) protein/tetratricopeptide (TPR) repeat protein